LVGGEEGEKIKDQKKKEKRRKSQLAFAKRGGKREGKGSFTLPCYRGKKKKKIIKRKRKE